MLLCLGLLAGITSANAQVGKEIKKDAKVVGNKTAELASKGKSDVVDKKYKNKVGPHGQTVYIDNHSRYYWVDKKGHKRFVDEGQLRNKPKKHK